MGYHSSTIPRKMVSKIVITLLFALLVHLYPLQSPLFYQTIDYTYTPTNEVSLSKINQLFELHKILVSTPSVSFYEKDVSFILANYLKNEGLNVDFQKINHKRYNILAYKGTQNDTKVLLTSHIDTVPPFFPYSLSEDGKKIYGRGSTDAKGSVAAQIITFLDLLQHEEIKEGDLSLLFVVGEENSGDGMKFIESNIDYKWETVILGEPTENKLGIGHKGVFGGVVKVNGLASHSGYPELGINANTILIDFLSKLLKEPLPSDVLLGESTLNIGQINGGVAANVIPAYAEAHISFRVSSNLEYFQKLVSKIISNSDYSDKIEFYFTNGNDPVFFNYEIEGFESIVLGYGTDAFSLKKRQFKNKILYGPGSIHVAHGAGEFVETDDLIKAVVDYKKLIRYALGF